MHTAEFESLSDAHLRTVVGVKWSMYPDCIGAFVAEMDYGTSPNVQHALRHIVDDGFFGYLGEEHAQQMREACAAWYLNESGWGVPVERIRALPDVIKGLEVAIEYFSPPGAPVLVPTPAYMPFLSLPAKLGRELVEIPMVVRNGRWEFDYDAIDAAFAATGKSGLLILCNPCNPLGRVYERAELERLSEVVDKHGGRVFSDEIHSPLLYPGHRHIPYASISETAANHTVTSTSASKAWNLAGLKCAQLVLSNDADAELWKSVGFLSEHGASTIGVIANAAAFGGGKPWLQEVIGYLDGNRQLLGNLLAEHLPQVGYIQPEGTYLTWLDFRAYDLPGDLAAFFRDEAKVAVVNGRACGEAGQGFIRFNIAMSRDTLVRAVRQMAAAVVQTCSEVAV